MKRALIFGTMVLAGGAAAYDIVPAGQDTYKISVPTSDIPVTTCDTCAPDQRNRVPDVAAVHKRATQQAREFCQKMNKSMDVTGGRFDMGPGYTLIFTCVLRR
jgi:hypothetical protein